MPAPDGPQFNPNRDVFEENEMGKWVDRAFSEEASVEDLTEFGDAGGGIPDDFYTYALARADRQAMSDISGDEPDPDMRFVHGRTAMPDVGQGQSTHHKRGDDSLHRPSAWVVQGGVVQDHLSMKGGGGGNWSGVGYPQDVFNDIFRPMVDQEFTAEELSKIATATGSSGPFSAEELLEHLGR
tara:strand:- start:412 stop:960 length:549 start_codon:yes stop_codon:yes gene_type:complete